MQTAQPQTMKVEFMFNSSPPGQNGHHCVDNIFDCIFLNGKDRIQIQLSMKYVPRSQIDKKLALVQVIACCRTGNKPLPEPMMTQFNGSYMRPQGLMS